MAVGSPASNATVADLDRLRHGLPSAGPRLAIERVSGGPDIVVARPAPIEDQSNLLPRVEEGRAGSFGRR